MASVSFRRPHRRAELRLHPRRYRSDANAQLLLNRRQLDHMVGAVERRGYTWYRWSCTGRMAAPNSNRSCKGKKQHDKRANDKDRDCSATRAAS